MPLDHDQPNLEHSPAEHDAEAVAEGSTVADCAEVLRLVEAWDAPEGPLLELACGSGRHLRELAGQGRAVTGVDLDPRMLDAARAAGLPPGCELIEADASALDLDRRFAAVLLFNRSLVCFHSHRQATGLFASIAGHLLPGGLALLDNCCSALWAEVANGNYGNGLSGDGRQQLFFLPGENRFVWRRDEAVDPESWSPRPSDRIYRLWSLGEVALAASGAGLALCCLASDSPFIVLRREER